MGNSRADENVSIAAANGGRVPALDGIRGVAILLVLIIHSYGLGVTKSGGLFYALARSGWTGVDLFFVLSGYLITGILLDTQGRPGYYRSFYIRRFLRIFPSYYLVVAALLVLGTVIEPLQNDGYSRLVENQIWIWTYTVNVEMTIANQAFDFGAFRPGTGIFETAHLWSLAVEEQFYLVWPFLVALIPPRRFVWAIVAVILLAPLLRFALINQNHSFAAFALTPCRMDTLAMGALVASLQRLVGLKSLSRFALPGVALSGSAALALAVFRKNYLEGDPAVATVGFSLNAILFASVLACSLTSPRRSILNRVLCFTPLQFLGKYSYSIYLVHAPLSGWLVQSALYDPEYAQKPPGWLFARLSLAFCVSLFGSCMLALVTWNVIEKRALSLKRFFPYPTSACAVRAE